MVIKYGENDRFLSWPMKMNIGMEIINQNCPKKNLIRQFKSSNGKTFKRPTDDRDIIIGHGWTKFERITTIVYTDGYICNNNLAVRLRVV